MFTFSIDPVMRFIAIDRHYFYTVIDPARVKRLESTKPQSRT